MVKLHAFLLVLALAGSVLASVQPYQGRRRAFGRIRSVPTPSLETHELGDPFERAFGIEESSRRYLLNARDSFVTLEARQPGFRSRRRGARFPNDIVLSPGPTHSIPRRREDLSRSRRYGVVFPKDEYSANARANVPRPSSLPPSPAKPRLPAQRGVKRARTI